MHSSRIVLISCFCWFGWFSLIYASESLALDNSVVIESRAVLVGTSDAILGIYLSNEVSIDGLVLPLELRSIDSGSYCSDHIEWVINPDGRLYRSSLGGTWGPNWDPGTITTRFCRTPDTLSRCSGPLSGSYSVDSSAVDFLSPDALLFVSVGNDDVHFFDPSLHAGADPLVRDSASLQLRFGASQTAGRFEIDTCCIQPWPHLLFAGDPPGLVIPSFTKGIVTLVDCGCACHDDPVCDDVHDILDVTATIARAFEAAPAVVDTVCTGQTLIAHDGPTDLDCSGATDIVDVIRMIGIAIRDEDPNLAACPSCPY